MIARKIETILKKELSEYPVVTIFGPRQSGKTTLAKMCCPDFDDISLEDELMLRGFMPELYRIRKDATAYYRNYFRTYVEHDVRRRTFDRSNGIRIFGNGIRGDRLRDDGIRERRDQ